MKKLKYPLEYFFREYSDSIPPQVMLLPRIFTVCVQYSIMSSKTSAVSKTIWYKCDWAQVHTADLNKLLRNAE